MVRWDQAGLRSRPTFTNDKCCSCGDALELSKRMSSGTVTIDAQSLESGCNSRSPLRRWEWHGQGKTTLRRSRACKGMSSGSRNDVEFGEISGRLRGRIKSKAWIFGVEREGAAVRGPGESDEKRGGASQLEGVKLVFFEFLPPMI